MLILASQSASRRAMLDAAGVPYRAIPAGIDEREFEAGLPAISPDAAALALAQAKALAISRKHPGELVLGSDSLVTAHGRRFDKPSDRAQAAEHLRWFSGRTIELHSAAALARGGHVVWDHTACARLRVHDLSDSFIEAYLDAEWPDVAGCVGVFRIEGRGVRLFSAIEGDHFTVLGMPLLAVLCALRDMGELPG
jgi:septum formation protein